MTITTAFVLAGGEGIRLRPLTDNLPKNLVPVAGKPLAEHTVDLLEKNGVKRVIFAVGYKKEMMKSQKKLWYYQKCVKFASPLFVKGTFL